VELSALRRRLTAACLLFALSVQVFLPWAQEAQPIQLSESTLAGAARKYGPTARLRLSAWVRLMAENTTKSEPDKLLVVNAFFNQIRWISDPEHWSKTDYWATPTEMLASNGGDCEDFAIAKYFTLLAIGVNIDKLKITYVKARDPNPINQAHMVLTYYQRPDSIPLVLDNLIPDIKPASERPDLTPVYAFNGDGLWLAKERSLGRVASGPGNITLWREMNSRIGKEFD